jgi:hypothetical protein
VVDKIFFKISLDKIIEICFMDTKEQEYPCTRTLSKAFTKKFVNEFFDDVEAYKRWGAIIITYQHGVFKTIKKEETIVNELHVK